ncbi:MAG: SLC13 family permease, partial [Alphaproteobacteria bacterium]|nr:SLC13 family permease [Alphaproteobacteria bacterium]
FCWVSRGFVPDLVPGLTDTGIAIAGALALFIVPAGARDSEGRGGALMNWESTARLPWGLILLFGGGLSLANAMAGSGLAEWISESLSVVSAWPLFLVIAAIVAVVVFLTELTSNAATTSAFVPVIAALAIGLGLDPVVLAAPAAMAASCAFMLPVATPPNAIVYGSGYISIPQMVKAGFWLNLLSIFMVTLFALVLLPLVFG